MIEKEDIKLIAELTKESDSEEVKALNLKCNTLLRLFELQNEIQEIQEKLSNLSKDEKEK